LNKQVVKVLLPLRLDEPFDYVAPEVLQPGSVVQVPLGNRKSFGVVWPDSTPCNLPIERIKPVLANYDCPPIPQVSLDFVDWASEYTLAPKGLFLRMMIPMEDGLHSNKAIPLYDLYELKGRITPQRQQVVDYLTEHPCRSVEDIEEATSVSRAVINGMIKAELLTIKDLREEVSPFQMPDVNQPGPTLNESQQVAADRLIQRAKDHQFSATLLDGVTGSGKTEVYYEAILEALKQGRQSLVMLPEIALSTQWLQRFEERFGVKPAIWHSELTSAQRRITWRAIIEGKAPVVVGARSALFLPYPKLGLIIVDEEHDGSYKQEEQVIYNARDMAVVRAQIGKLPCILASATPSLETMINVQTSKYDILHLESRFGGATMPDVHVVDLRRAKSKKEVSSQKWLGEDLRQALAETVERGEQAMLFLNRRGYAPLTLCSDCGERLKCVNCDSWLVHHQNSTKLQCHHCGYFSSLPNQCPGCEEKDTWVACGPGVERIAEEAQSFLPKARLGILTSDTMNTPKKMAEIIGQIQDHQLDVLVGTQIMAKGYHFPKLTFVGVVDADISLSNGDLRAAEKTYQLLHQVAGRSGRGELPGHVWLQTYNPENPVMQAICKGQRDQFLAIESEERKAHGFPPFGRLISIIISGKNRYDVENASKALARAFPHNDSVQLMGPSPAAIAFLRGRTRWRLLVKSSRRYPLQKFVKSWLSRVELKSSLRLQIDVDPYNFM
jgi:primosomal protein N' (replication factor Y)